MEWQDISTAPKDWGEPVLLYCRSWVVPGRMLIGHWHEGNWWTADGLYEVEGFDAPTHWMPLPEPPHV